ncbi:SelB C-terminal domain-containing protein [Glaciimonas sp. CA11.2]|uniref:selenocysteine-specific translation elongation factor n=1 Tax=unclassified Glaciimonas TaxID=2644401 RepID=UPI002AB38CE5|nr:MULTISPECIES: SelB C-terminal domain-containing protein [unclassified Glaciimonas]MDY7548534.1 SelB C-terminal domain-containing protein [Glaciimonas sp. CA11.2]MEB0013721.1 SelB C-terminal domain-containing protein [Glaciimonas sp. Cout2]MEB0083326.1 SelB C-terminal domain-containing protein [Glaciimonas sp. Gout2]MEB0164150.1 SelB C-terminal domain-containing protein [Glaciimonas sp. CA11.2]
MIVGTAGHIDHGKTTLTRALTGVDTDRLKEEKERGISIELGYAYLPLPNGEVLGLIDVPGHEKLIHTMAAGASGIDFALLVIAADDGIMPQTREHLAILAMLGVKRGAVALTKIDRVDSDRMAAVEQDINVLLASTPFSGAQIFRTQAHIAGDPGVAALLAYLTLSANNVNGTAVNLATNQTNANISQIADATLATSSMPDERLFRLAIDRVFTLAGHGTIIAGTALAGHVAVDDTLILAPSGERVRVRSIHAQNRPSASGHAGQRLALNLVGVPREQISRGDWILSPALAECSERIDGALRLLSDAGLSLKSWSPVHVHLGAAHRTAHVVLLDGDVIVPGQESRVQLVFDAPLHAVPGDRFVIRNAQASRTIGGGRVLDPFGPATKRRSAARHAWRDALAAFVDSGDSAALLDCNPLGLYRSGLVRLSQLPPERLVLPIDTRSISIRDGDAVLISRAAWDALAARTIEGLRTFHASTPDDIGPQIGRLRRIVEPDMDESLWRALVASLCATGMLVQQGPWLHLPEHTVELRADELALAIQLLASLEAAGFSPPWVRDLAREHGAGEAEVRDLLCKLAKRAEVSQIVKDLFYHPSKIDDLARIVAVLANDIDEAGCVASTGAKARLVSAAAFRDATGIGRKRAIQLLEFFDRVGYTRRLKDTHILRPNALWGSDVML